LGVGGGGSEIIFLLSKRLRAANYRFDGGDHLIMGQRKGES